MRKRLLCFGMCVALCVIALPRPAGAGLFGSKEVESANLTAFPKWTGALERYFSESKLKDQPCTADGFNRCDLQEWAKFIETIRHLPFKDRLSEVNRFINKHDYVLDIINWGVPDYWETPYQFFVNNGDCEDFAIAKFMSLRALGVPNDDMRIVVLTDENLGIIHSVLSVKYDNTFYILDNQIEQVVSDRSIHHYTPVYSINETHWWRHSQ